MDINEQKRYVFKKDYTNETGTIHQGTIVTLFRGFVYCDGGMCDPYSTELIRHLIQTPQLKNVYLEEKPIPTNKV